jgi:hypothetical protein
MTPKAVKQLKVGCEVITSAFAGRVTCVDLIDDDRIVIKWDCADSEDVLCDASPLWTIIEEPKT